MCFLYKLHPAAKPVPSPVVYDKGEIANLIVNLFCLFLSKRDEMENAILIRELICSPVPILSLNWINSI